MPTIAKTHAALLKSIAALTTQLEKAQHQLAQINERAQMLNKALLDERSGRKPKRRVPSPWPTKQQIADDLLALTPSGKRFVLSDRRGLGDLNLPQGHYLLWAFTSKYYDRGVSGTFAELLQRLADTMEDEKDLVWLRTTRRWERKRDVLNILADIKANKETSAIPLTITAEELRP